MIKKSKEYKLINIVGIDGSGKSTLGEGLVSILLDEGLRSQLIYCQYFAKLLYPIKKIAKHTVMKDTDEFADYKLYINQKTGFAQRHKILGNLYAFLWLIDYSMQVFFKVNRKVTKYDFNIIDRYLFDIVVNISILAGWHPGQANRILKFMFSMHPVPDLIIFTDLPEEEAFSRKNDIQSVQYLKERREFYKLLAKQWKFQTIDGTKKKHMILKEATELICRKLKLDCA